MLVDMSTKKVDMSTKKVDTLVDMSTKKVDILVDMSTKKVHILVDIDIVVDTVERVVEIVDIVVVTVDDVASRWLVVDVVVVDVLGRLLYTSEIWLDSGWPTLTSNTLLISGDPVVSSCASGSSSEPGSPGDSLDDSGRWKDDDDVVVKSEAAASCWSTPAMVLASAVSISTLAPEALSSTVLLVLDSGHSVLALRKN